MLTIYRRHVRECEHKDKGRKYRRCRCVIWVDGFLGDHEIRHSLRTRDWQKAQDRVREMEAAGKDVQPANGPVTLGVAWEAFLADAEKRGLREPTLYKYRLLKTRMEDFAKERGLRCITEFDVAMCREFRVNWPDHNLAALKNLERLRAFFRFCQEAGWIQVNTASKVANPRIQHKPKEPFTREEWLRILSAVDGYRAKHNKASREHVLRLRALVLLLRYSGLRIGDAVTLSRHRIDGDRLLLRTAKTGTPVCCLLPTVVIRALECVPLRGEYFFWSGESKTKAAVGDWQRTFRNLFKLAEVEGGHPHRFRHTFAIENLQAGVPIEDVAALLGHQSIRVTERHYAAWVRSRQERLDERVRLAWADDPLVKGTQEVHGESRRVQ
ncbi:MAG: tyrosine-type recombinase/integrase [Acidobacteria bacterium]|nr:tyrosine-type recombinase/integrase [Acidobacteriota bacterium]